MPQSVANMSALQITLRLHINQPGHRPFKLKRAFAFNVKLLNRYFGATNQFYFMLVQRIDQRDKALGFIAFFPGQFGNIGQDQDVEAVADFQIIGGTQRMYAEFVKAAQRDIAAYRGQGGFSA